jgi:hypothetical protein
VKRLVLLVAASVVLAGSVASAAPQSGRFVVVFAKPKTSDERILTSLLQKAQMPLVFGELSKHMVLPRNITISVQGGEDGPYYDPRARKIVLNHPFSVLAFNTLLKEYPGIKPYDLGKRFAALEYFVLFHEVGHALVDQWDLPVLGREEDAVDAFSTIFMTDLVKQGDFAYEGAKFFYFIASAKVADVDFADEHSLDKQRAYSIACWVYGADARKYAYIGKVLPASRRVRCADEYRQLKKAWYSLLKPHLR